MKNSPFPPELDKYWNRLSDLERQMSLDQEGLFSLTPPRLALEIANRLPGATVIDCFCGAGGMAIGLALSGKRVTAIDLSAERLKHAEVNAKLFGVTLELLHGDCRELLAGRSADLVFLDPPWGGPSYSNRESFSLGDFSPPGEALIEIGFRVAPAVGMNLPKNFDSSDLERWENEIWDNQLDDKLLHRTALLKRP